MRAVRQAATLADILGCDEHMGDAVDQVLAGAPSGDTHPVQHGEDAVPAVADNEDGSGSGRDYNDGDGDGDLDDDEDDEALFAAAAKELGGRVLDVRARDVQYMTLDMLSRAHVASDLDGGVRLFDTPDRPATR